MSMNIQIGAMTDRHSIAEARRNLPSLVRDAENGRAVELTRRGEPVAVLIGLREFERLTSGRRGFGDAYREFATSVELDGLALDPDELFGDVRDEAPGREVRL
jgi:prevent-host-death family protein